MSTSRGRRGRILAAAVASGALVAAGSAITTGPAQSAEPTGDCAQPFPVADVTRDQPVHGLTVTEGTEPGAFEGAVIGTLHDGIAPGLDMVMAELSNETIDEVGIWQGMSGSPVYAEDGRLIGAVAYGLSAGNNPVAGITPFEDMDDYLTRRAPETVSVSKAQARAIARQTDVTFAEAREGFRQLPMPLAASGTDRRPRDLTGKQRKYLLPAAGSTVGSGEAQAGAESIVAGGNLAATVSYGDVTLAGVGTVTSVCDGEVIGFGHPMTFGGRTSMGLSPADALYVHDDPTWVGFKVANVGEPVGTISNDRLTGISGPLGELPPVGDISTEVTMGERSQQLLSHSTDGDYNPDVLFTQALGSHDRVVDALTEGSSEVTYEASGTDAAGRPFSVAFADRYQSDFDISFEAMWDPADVTWVLSSMSGVEVDDIALTSSVVEDASTYRLRQLEVRRGGTWQPVTARQALRVRAGRVLQLRVKVVSPQDTRHIRLATRIPAKAAGRPAYLSVQGGGSSWSDFYGAQTPQELARSLRKGPRNDEVVARVDFAKRKVADKTVTSRELDRVVLGGRHVSLRVVR